MALNIREFCPLLSIPVIKQRINVRYKQILAAEKWSFLFDSTVVRLYAQHTSVTGETVAVYQTGTSVEGTGTTFASGHVGWYMRFGDDPQEYIISTIVDATGLTIESDYANADTTQSAYTLSKRVHSPAVGNVNEIIDVVYKTRLVERSQEFLNNLDPERTSTGEPVYWSNVSKTTAVEGIVSFEVWPVPSSDYAVTVYYRKTISDLTEDTDSPVFRTEILEAGTLFDCYRLSYAVTQNPAFIGLARDAKTDYEVELRRMILEDMDTQSLPRRVKNVFGVSSFDDNFTLDHDVDML